MRRVSVLVVIVNYRTPLLALNAAGALEAEIRARGDAHVVIVDNGSGDDSDKLIEKGIEERGYRDWCTLLAETRNGGFAAGNNIGIAWYAHATGELPEFAWLLNPDTIAEPGAMTALVDFLREHPDVGIAGSRCLEPDGTVWPSAFRFQSPRTEFNAAVNFGPVTRLLGNPVIAPPQPETPQRTDWVSGTSMMVRREVLDEIGTMDEGYFLYFEETDYCAHAAEGGYQSWTVPASRVTHIGGQSTGVTGEKRAQRRRPRYWFASRARFFLYQHGLVRTHLANLLWLVGYPVGRLIAALRGKKNDDPPLFWWDFLRAYYGKDGIMYAPRLRARRMGDGND